MTNLHEAGTGNGAARRSSGRPDKLAAIMRGARTVFGREGYARTSIEVIAAEAGVSTRTIYKHFASKESLFSAVLQDSATRVAQGFLAKVDRSLTGTDLRGDLVALGEAFAARRTDFPDHFAMTDRFRAEAPHLSPAIIDAWKTAGPLRVEEEVVRRVRQFADRGLLRVEDPRLAATHFMALMSAGAPNGPLDLPLLPGREAGGAIAAAVDAFLDGYRAARLSAPTA
jgi:AcrR family transcriptional regulator